MSGIALIKISEEKHIKSLILKGELHFETIEYFRKADEDHRFDSYEGYDVITQPKDIASITIGDHPVKIHPDSPPILLKLKNRIEYTHLCCFTVIRKDGLSVNGKQHIFHPDMFLFGDSLAFIINPKAFIERIKECLDNDSSIEYYQMHEVEYYDPKEYSGDLNPFMKRNRYQIQNECRIVIQKKTKKPLNIYLGNMKDIIVGPIKKELCINIIEDGNAILTY
jgi:hypothetical protein